MYKTKFEDNLVVIGMEESVLKSLGERKFNYMEIFRLIENFSQQLLGPRKNGPVRLENEDTRAQIDIDIQWNEKDKEASIHIVDVNLSQTDNGRDPHSKRTKFDFTPPPEENPGQESQGKTLH